MLHLKPLNNFIIDKLQDGKVCHPEILLHPSNLLEPEIPTMLALGRGPRRQQKPGD